MRDFCDPSASGLALLREADIKLGNVNYQNKKHRDAAKNVYELISLGLSHSLSSRSSISSGKGCHDIRLIKDVGYENKLTSPLLSPVAA
jgi:hypothetical protein